MEITENIIDDLYEIWFLAGVINNNDYDRAFSLAEQRYYDIFLKYLNILNY